MRLPDDPTDDDLCQLWASAHMLDPVAPLEPGPTDWSLSRALQLVDPRDETWGGIQRAVLTELEPPRPRPWRATARRDQLPPPGRWRHWLIMSGRGWGKTFTGSNVLAEMALTERGDYAIVAPTLGDAKKICVDGPSGFLAALGGEHGGNVASYNRSEYIITLINGSRVVLGSADAPDRIRGWNLRAVWCDEVGSWRDAKVWNEGIKFATRVGDPRIIITTTPTRGNRVLTKLLETYQHAGGALTGGLAANTFLTRGSTRDNVANLSADWLREIEEEFAGTALGRQELDGELLTAVPGALITMEVIERSRLVAAQVPELRRIVVAVDPSVSNTEDSDECGIIVAGIGAAPQGWEPPPGVPPSLADVPHIYWLEDRSLRGTPEAWGLRALEVAEEWAADVIAAEVNNGGDLVGTMINQTSKLHGLKRPRVHQVRASVGKRARAEPIGGAWQQHCIHSVGAHKLLEDQWQSFVPGASAKSPDRLDASVWGAVELMPEFGVKSGTLIRATA